MTAEELKLVRGLQTSCRYLNGVGKEGQYRHHVAIGRACLGSSVGLVDGCAWAAPGNQGRASKGDIGSTLWIVCSVVLDAVALSGATSEALVIV